MIQEIIVAAIGIIVGIILIYKIFSFFFRSSKSKGSCGCSSCHCNTSQKINKI